MVDYGVIPKFDGEHFFLSNFYETPFIWRNREFKTGEAAFQSAKYLAMTDVYINDITAYIKKCQEAPTPAKAKYAGRSVKIDVNEWNAMRVSLMREIVHAKFMTSEESLVGPLINTGAKMLVEGNDWGDDFWGRTFKDGKWVGFNTLGVILMEERGWWSRSDEGRP